MKNTIIKPLHEYFSQTLTGDSFNSSNGVFKVNYKAYDDLSISVGRDPDPSLLVKDSAFQIGDLVKGSVKGRNKKIEGEVIETYKEKDGKSYKIKIQRAKDNKIYTLIPGSIEFVSDRGNSTTDMRQSISARQKNAQNLKYTGGNIVWGSLESNNSDYISTEEGIVEGPMGTGWKIKFEDEIPANNLMFKEFSIDPTNQIISCKRSSNLKELKNKIKAIECYCYLMNHPEIKDVIDDIKCLASILFLEMKNEQEAKKFMIMNFPEAIGKSYGEVRDNYLKDSTDLINRFI